MAAIIKEQIIIQALNSSKASLPNMPSETNGRIQFLDSYPIQYRNSPKLLIQAFNSSKLHPSRLSTHPRPPCPSCHRDKWADLISFLVLSNIVIQLKSSCRLSTHPSSTHPKPFLPSSHQNKWHNNLIPGSVSHLASGSSGIITHPFS